MSQTPTADPVADLVTGRDFRMLIGGDLVEAVDGATFETVDPSTGRTLTSVPQGGAADVDAAVRAGLAAYPAWAALGVEGRTEVFARFAAAVAEHGDRLAMLDAVDGGMPYRAMLVDIQISLANIRDWPTLVRWHGGRTIPASSGNLHYTSQKPFGVVGKIIPFNHPVMFAITRVLPALIAGNAVVLKPAQQTPLSALALSEIAREIFPPGILNIVTGGADTGDALVTHPDVKRIAFTGSARTGMVIQQRAATAAIKAISLELGGKNPMIVFPDMDVDRAVDGAINGMNFGVCTGQSCGSNSRVFVHADLYETFLDRVGARLEAMHVAPAYDPAVDMGPLVTEQHYGHVMGYVDAGRREGARLITGGERPNGSTPAGGNFLRPTLFADVTADMAISREEIFGPVIAAAAWEDVDDVVARANDTDLGLAASVWTNDLHLAHRTADQLEAGYVWINDSSRHYWGMPFGGMKNSGLGREECTEEYDSYTEQKSVHTILEESGAAFSRLRR